MAASSPPSLSSNISTAASSAALCETACPSGVVYHELIEAVRPQVAQSVLGNEKRGRNGMLQWMVGNVLPYSGRAAAAVAPLKLARKIGLGGVAEKFARMLPGPLGAMADLLPAGAAHDEPLPLFTPALGKPRGNVVLLRGCVGSVVSGPVNAACVRVIARNGFDVHLLANEPCCGAMAAHGNDPEAAKNFAQAMVDSLSAKGGDYFVSPIAGCGAQLKQLAHWVDGEHAKAPSAACAMSPNSSQKSESSPRAVPLNEPSRTTTLAISSMANTSATRPESCSPWSPV